MQIVIEIPDEVYKKLTETAIMVTEVYPSTIERALTEGIVLPKGHGKLVDVEDVKRNHKRWLGYIDDDMISRMNYTIENHIPILLEADKEGAEE